MNVHRIYIMGVAASGKSTFAKRHASYEGYKIVDFAEKLPGRSTLTTILLYLSRVVPSLKTILRKRKDIIATDSEHYFAMVAAYLARQTRPVAVLGRRTPENLEKLDMFKDVALAMVLVPENDHRRNCEARKRKLRNPLPFFDHWTTDFTRIMDARERSKEYAERHDIPVFESFSSAITALSARKFENTHRNENALPA